MQNTTVYIGIDPGVNTGIAIWKKADKSLKVQTLSLHKAFDLIKDLAESETVFVRIEDARLRKWFGGSGREKLQGAGSVKRDCSAWQEFLTDHSIPHQFLSPQQKGKKVSPEQFKELTGVTSRTSQHGRDAAMLVFGF